MWKDTYGVDKKKKKHKILCFMDRWTAAEPTSSLEKLFWEGE